MILFKGAFEMVEACASLSLIFLILAGLFIMLGDKGAMFISGFNTLSKDERELYDKQQLVQATRNSLLLWSIILGIGAVLSYIVSSYAGVISFIIWIFLFCKDLHWDARKAFEKYKK